MIEMWCRLKKRLPKPKGRHGNDDRLFMEAICWMLRTGAAWRDLPPDYGNWKSVYNRSNNWSKKGYIAAILAELKKNGDHEWHSLDGSIVKVHQDAMRREYSKSEEAIGYSVGGLSTKIHAKVDAFGQLVNILLTPGQIHESQVAQEVFAGEDCKFFLADKAYDIDSFRASLIQKGIQPVIPSKIKPTAHDRHIYKERNLVERFFQKIKRYRRIGTRYDKTARMDLTRDVR